MTSRVLTVLVKELHKSHKKHAVVFLKLVVYRFGWHFLLIIFFLFLSFLNRASAEVEVISLHTTPKTACTI